MKIALLSGAYGNAGDSLIEQRSKALLEYAFSGASVNVFSRKQIREKLEEINACDIAFFSGGPIYQKNISANFDLAAANQIDIPLRIIGGGYKGYCRSQQLPYTYRFEPETFNLFKKINNNNGLSCRDLFSVKALKSNGLSNAKMTGCPAWYDLNYIHDLKLHQHNNERQVICVSDPALASNSSNVLPLLEYLHGAFSSSVIKYVLHRGKQTADYENVHKTIENLGYVEVVDLFPDIEAFKIYDSCDLHIGFRVHAHIYNLSHRRRSILIEEDGRGGGVNEALGLPALLAYSDVNQNNNRLVREASRITGKNKNRFLIEQLDSYIGTMDNDIYFENAFRLMESYFSKMEDYLKEI